MRNISLFVLVCAGFVVSVFGQNTTARVVGMWKHDKEGLTFQFNADGTFTMGEEEPMAKLFG
jgi:hypothetical protein